MYLSILENSKKPLSGVLNLWLGRRALTSTIQHDHIAQAWLSISKFVAVEETQWRQGVGEDSEALIEKRLHGPSVQSIRGPVFRNESTFIL
jgi:hypothetical protein